MWIFVIFGEKKDREKEGERDVEHFEFMFDSTILQNETAIC